MRYLPNILILAALLLVGSAALSIPAGTVGNRTANSPEMARALATVYAHQATPTPTPADAPAQPALATPATPATADGSVVAQLSADPAAPSGGALTTGLQATATPESEPEPVLDPIPAAEVATTARFAPLSVAIPRFGVDAAIVPVGITPEGAMEAPSDYWAVGWYRYGPTPGETGRAILAGHVDSRTGPAVFYRLGDLASGDEVVVRTGGTDSGRELVYIVRETSLYWTEEVPLDLVYGPSERPELVLITCGGPFDRAAGGYLQRHIVVAELRDGG